MEQWMGYIGCTSQKVRYSLTEITRIEDFAPPDVETGVGLALMQGERYVFCILGTRDKHPKDALYFAGIGGHLESGESWLDCAYREADEEIGATIDIIASDATWCLSHDRSAKQVDVTNEPRP